uniref:Ovule protein n=1 Tax=Angiostrongylus cantonensis TaxID=6313 RepID=A0A0K0DJ55_ANGCA
MLDDENSFRSSARSVSKDPCVTAYFVGAAITHSSDNLWSHLGCDQKGAKSRADMGEKINIPASQPTLLLLWISHVYLPQHIPLSVGFLSLFYREGHLFLFFPQQ